MKESFLPENLRIRLFRMMKRELGLPTFKEKDAIYTYHFIIYCNVLKNHHRLYKSEGLDAGEKVDSSRS
jgi:hypothetical protein